MPKGGPMLRRLLIASLSIFVMFAVSCASKKKAGEGADGDSATISQESFNFNSQGSDSGQIQGLATINFPYDSSSLDSSSRQTLKDNADWMKKNSGLTIQIEGHCDSRGSVEYNLALGERRAKVVKDYLLGLGIAGSRMTIISYGKEKLLELGDSEAVHARNRRANFVPLAN